MNSGEELELNARNRETALEPVVIRLSMILDVLLQIREQLSRQSITNMNK